MLGFRDRQTVSAIETGARQLTAVELVRAAHELDASLDYFTDPFRLIGEGRFSWRHTRVAPADLDACEQATGRWIAAYRSLAPQVGVDLRVLNRNLLLTPQSSFEAAMRAGEDIADVYGLGSCPATDLRRVMEEKLGVLVLMVDAPEGISGAACQLPELQTVLISRREVVGRRHFDLAHELFHLLTWDAMPPARAENPRTRGRDRKEQLADSFAGAVLMPTRELDRFDSWDLERTALISKLHRTADEFAVSASALRWRLASLGRLRQEVAKSLSDSDLRHNGPGPVDAPRPPLFSKRFMEVIGLAIDQGFISIRRTARLLDLTLEELRRLFGAHELRCSLDI